MFSGIIEETSKVLQAEAGNQSIHLWVSRPASFNDIALGDSIAVNGTCLTVEKQEPDRLLFTMGAETLKVIGVQDPAQLLVKPVNLERSMRLGDRIHGHLVSGHVDMMAELTHASALGDSWLMKLRLPAGAPAALWKKGSITLNGVSLTVNEVSGGPTEGKSFEVTLIPETLKRTNLKFYHVGEKLTVEMDWMAKGVMNALQNMDLSQMLSAKP